MFGWKVDTGLLILSLPLYIGIAHMGVPFSGSSCPNTQGNGGSFVDGDGNINENQGVCEEVTLNIERTYMGIFELPVYNDGIKWEKFHYMFFTLFSFAGLKIGYEVLINERED